MRPAGPSLNDCSRSRCASAAATRRGNSPTTNRRCDRSCSAPTRWSSTAAPRRLAPAGAGPGSGPAAGAPGRERTLLLDVCDLLTAAVTAEPPHHAGRGMAARQFLPDRRADPHGQAAPAARTTAASCPRLAHGPSAGLPRVYDIALETISHGDGRVDAGEPRPLRRAPTRRSAPLKLGELWAIPIMLRLALIENLRRVGVRIAAGHDGPRPRRAWADQMMEVAERDPKSLILVIADMARSKPPMVSAFVAELARRLQGQSAAPGAAADLDRAAALRVGPDDRAAGAVGEPAAGGRPGLDQQQHRQPALPGRDGLARVRRDDERRRADAARGSRRTSTAGWTSPPATATATRSRSIARRSPLSESEVARKAIELAARAPPTGRRDGDDDRTRPRRLLPDRQGAPQLERGGGVRALAVEALRRIRRARNPAAPLPGRDRGCMTAAMPPASSRSPHARRDLRPGLAAVGVVLLLATSQLARGAGELAGDPAGDAATAAAHGLLPGHSARSRARWSWCRPC